MAVLEKKGRKHQLWTQSFLYFQMSPVVKKNNNNKKWKTKNLALFYTLLQRYKPNKDGIKWLGCFSMDPDAIRTSLLSEVCVILLRDSSMTSHKNSRQNSRKRAGVLAVASKWCLGGWNGSGRPRKAAFDTLEAYLDVSWLFLQDEIGHLFRNLHRKRQKQITQK